MKQDEVLCKKGGIRLRAAVAACKLCRKVLRIVGRGGTSLPGKLALRICPELLRYCSDGMEIVIVSGTNGKTTTCRIIEQGLKAAGKDVLSNRSGANLFAGITAEFAANTSLSGERTKHVAVIECDEAALKTVIKYVQPAALVITNIFRDQLDRYGEIMNTRESLRTAIEQNSKMLLCLNADDSLVVSLADRVENPCVYYGIEEKYGNGRPEDASDAMYCIRCRHKYSYHYKTYGHLGAFHCPNCGYSRPKPQISAKRIIAMFDDHSLIDLDVYGEIHEQGIPLPSVYNIYNCLAAAAGLHALGLALPGFEDDSVQVHGFGRMERFRIGAGVTMILVKNPAGFTQVINYLSLLEQDYDLMCCLDDRLADGEDVSWIWDVPFERLAEYGAHLKNVYAAGRRKEDMHLRLKYAGFDGEKLKLIHNDRHFVQELEKAPRQLVMLPTYSAMMRLRPVLAKKNQSRQFWE